MTYKFTMYLRWLSTAAFQYNTEFVQRGVTESAVSPALVEG
jgi:hypothetical protein